MAKALCFECGDVKDEGGLSNCKSCGAAPSVDMNLNLAFSEAYLTPATLAAFGDVIKSINRVTNEQRLRFWSFARYVSLHHDDVLEIDIPPAIAKECDEVLAQANPPSVVVEESGAQGTSGGIQGEFKLEG